MYMGTFDTPVQRMSLPMYSNAFKSPDVLLYLYQDYNEDAGVFCPKCVTAR